MVDSPSNRLEGVQATLLMPLWARSVEARHPEPIVRDEKSVAIVESVDYDFGQFERKLVPIADYCIRSRIIDDLVRPQLEARPDITVVELGVGLDTRFDRLDNGQVRWIEFDLPDVIELRIGRDRQATDAAGSELGKRVVPIRTQSHFAVNSSVVFVGDFILHDVVVGRLKAPMCDAAVLLEQRSQISRRQHARQRARKATTLGNKRCRRNIHAGCELCRVTGFDLLRRNRVGMLAHAVDFYEAVEEFNKRNRRFGAV